MGRTIGEYNEQYLRRQRPWLLWLKILGAATFIGVTVTVLAFACSWGGAARDVVSPENVRAQWQFSYDYSESLRGVAGNWCTARRTELETVDPTARDQRVTQRIAIENNYRRVQNEYDARLADAFRAKLVRPGDVPARAPTLDEQLRAVGCEVAPGTAQPAPVPTASG